METKPWYMTSESWIMIGTQILAVLSITGVLTPAQADVLTKQITVVAGAVIAIFGALGFSWGRIQVKKIRAELIAKVHASNIEKMGVTAWQDTKVLVNQAKL